MPNPRTVTFSLPTPALPGFLAQLSAVPGSDPTPGAQTAEESSLTVGVEPGPAAAALIQAVCAWLAADPARWVKIVVGTKMVRVSQFAPEEGPELAGWFDRVLSL